MNPREIALALVAACHDASCAPPPAGTGGSKPGTHRLTPNVPPGTPEPGSERSESSHRGDWDGRTRVTNTTPWQVSRVSIGKGSGVPGTSDAQYRRLVDTSNEPEDFGALLFEGRTRRGALAKARKLAKEYGASFVVHTSAESGNPDDELIWHRADPPS